MNLRLINQLKAIAARWGAGPAVAPASASRILDTLMDASGATLTPDRVASFDHKLDALIASLGLTVAQPAGRFKKLAVVAAVESLRYDPRTVFGSDLVTWYGNSVDDLWREQAAGAVTLYQDNVGTTPITALEQTVGLILDKSKGLELGPELVGDPGLLNAAYWDNTSPTVSVASGSATWINAGSGARLASQSLTGSAGKTYLISVSVESVSQGSLRIADANGTQLSPDFSSVGVNTYRVRAVLDSAFFLRCVGTTSAVVTAYSVRELPGHHLSQPTATSRGRLSARYNFVDNAALVGGGPAPTGWSRPSAAGVNNSEPVRQLPDGSWVYRQWGGPTARMYLDRFLGTTVAVGQVWRQRVVIDAMVGAPQQIQNVLTRTGSATVTVEWRKDGVTVPQNDLIDGPCIAEAFWTITGAGTFITRFGGGCTNNPGNAYDFEFSRPDCRLTVWPASWPQYQRVTTASDYDTVGFPARLVMDGVDDSWLTGAIDLTSTGQVTVFMTASATATGGLFTEFGAGAQNGSFSIPSPDVNARCTFFIRGATANSFATTGPNYPVPFLRTFTGLGDLPASLGIFRIDGAQVSSASSNTGGGNYGNYPIHVGRRNNSVTPLRGDIFSLPMVVRRLATPEEITAAESAFGRTIGVLQ